MRNISFLFVALLLLFSSCRKNDTTASTDQPDSASYSITEKPASDRKITAEMAFEGVNNYCHSEYDWKIAEENPSIMGVEMSEETDSAYVVAFRSYTGSYTYFYVDKKSGSTRMDVTVPNLGIREEAGTINLFDYLSKE